jgi:hypothetical protein
MHYFQRSDTRPEALIQLPTGRPHAVLVRMARADSAQADTTVVDANAMEIVDQASFTARGNVEIVRDSVRGFGSEAHFNQDRGGMVLIGSARLVAPEYEMVGDTIDAETDENEDIREIVGSGNARLTAEDADVAAPRVRILFEEGAVSRLIAVAVMDSGGVAATVADSLSRRARVISADFRLEADSIDAVAPAEIIERVTAVGGAYGERITSDLANANLPPIAATDWMRGDTIVATFSEDPESVDSAGRRERVLDQVLAVGTGDLATSFYRTTTEDDPDAPPSFNYIRAVRITVALVAGKVSSIEAEEQVHGLNLEPVRRSSTDRGAPVENGRSSS